MSDNVLTAQVEDDAAKAEARFRALALEIPVGKVIDVVAMSLMCYQSISLHSEYANKTFLEVMGCIFDTAGMNVSCEASPCEAGKEVEA